DRFSARAVTTPRPGRAGPPLRNWQYDVSEAPHRAWAARRDAIDIPARAIRPERTGAVTGCLSGTAGSERNPYHGARSACAGSLCRAARQQCEGSEIAPADRDSSPGWRASAVARSPQLRWRRVDPDSGRRRVGVQLRPVGRGPVGAGWSENKSPGTPRGFSGRRAGSAERSPITTRVGPPGLRREKMRRASLMVVLATALVIGWLGFRGAGGWYDAGRGADDAAAASADAGDGFARFGRERFAVVARGMRLSADAAGIREITDGGRLPLWATGEMRFLAHGTHPDPFGVELDVVFEG